MKISTIHHNSLAEAIGLKSADSLLKINGKRVLDEIDYRFRIAEERLVLDIEIDGKMEQVEIEKEYDDDLGVEFEDTKIRMCANNCVFCFAEQNPEGMRKSLFFKDGDYRLSYLHGHYITLTNMGKSDLERVVTQRLTPLYVSVHATDSELRKKLFLYGNKDDKLLDKLKYLTSNGIYLHTQIVVIPGENDGVQLAKTLSDLHSMYPMIMSVSIVPVGLTKHREGLMKISSASPKYAQRMVELSQKLSIKYPGIDGRPFILLSDEWYILSQNILPEISEYDDIDLIENGVGQVRRFLEDFETEKKSIPKSFDKPTEFTIITGKLIYNIFNKEVGSFLNSIPNLKVNIIPIINDFMGHSVTVTGLITGKDIISQLKDKNLGLAVWCTYRILNEDGNLTLDDLSLSDISKEIGVPINISQDSILEIFERKIIG